MLKFRCSATISDICYISQTIYNFLISCSYVHPDGFIVIAFDFWRARGPSGLARFVEHIFSVCGLLYSGRRRAMFRCLEMSVCIKLRQCWKKRPAHGISSFRDLMLMIGTYRLKVGTFSQIRTDTVTRD